MGSQTLSVNFSDFARKYIQVTSIHEISTWMVTFCLNVERVWCNVHRPRLFIWCVSTMPCVHVLTDEFYSGFHLSMTYHPCVLFRREVWNNWDLAKLLDLSGRFYQVEAGSRHREAWTLFPLRMIPGLQADTSSVLQHSQRSTAVKRAQNLQAFVRLYITFQESFPLCRSTVKSLGDCSCMPREGTN